MKNVLPPRTRHELSVHQFSRDPIDTVINQEEREIQRFSTCKSNHENIEKRRHPPFGYLFMLCLFGRCLATTRDHVVIIVGFEHGEPHEISLLDT